MFRLPSKSLILLSILINVIVVGVSLAENLSIVSVGDSITAGLMRNTNNEITCPPGVSSAPICTGDGAANVGGYQPPLKLLLDSDGYQTTIYNFGISGIRTDAMVSQLPSILNSRPDAQYVLIMGGTNDAFVPVSVSSVVFNLKVMTDFVISRGLTPVLSTVTRINSVDNWPEMYSDAIRNLASQNNIKLADPSASMKIDWNTDNPTTLVVGPLHSGDGLHFNSKANQQFALDWHKALALEKINNITLVPILSILLLDE